MELVNTLRIPINSEEEFTALVKSHHLPTVTLFQTAWSGDAFMMNMMLESIIQEYKGKLQLCCIDVEKLPNLKKTFFVTEIPTILFFKHGKLVGKIKNILPSSVIKMHLNSFLNAA